ncbi:hypothetical protein CO005_02095 [Candidatus Roizmanbacteria bacterium CG_4_8_14_3_um_filter_34_9]|uniref:DUF5615 domain-containing protein n=3 Tax=Candidatus Roizmaniibacteriota TaxID=1752723 RepID=A0A2M7AU46_9BACT|nr:MAG: hypothetical protein COT02_03210 [Candidatus Roizmanbacteria bacterium CG07_land_8_20_14_0_80_34_15]PIU74142.1 MAG: hypothetical protein COS77_03085 [Candidatus Roizmanbacteria bacterium CG06_land_8_20_14_3_00_34_14]PIW73318.1 MAG: hypothetical protein CO005_02095 [Candidatus Roizmanbacteria bacterium CG_4_8_14_3_um_filter_34_9]
MKFLIDESIEYRIVGFLRSLDYNTLSVAESFSSLDDKIILSIAYKESRIIITNDKDFGELIYKLQLPHKGIILIRLFEENYQSKEDKLKLILKKFKSKLQNTFTIVSKNKIRFKKS